MDLRTLLLSFDGRIRRTHFWLAAIGVYIAGLIVVSLISTIFGLGNVFMFHTPGAGSFGPGMILGGPLLLVVWLAMAWALLALQVKRWHDRDKSWFWIFIGLIPVIGGLWVLVECGFLDGTQGSNRFGPSPKGIGAAS